MSKPHWQLAREDDHRYQRDVADILDALVERIQEADQKLGGRMVWDTQTKPKLRQLYTQVRQYAQTGIGRRGTEDAVRRMVYLLNEWASETGVWLDIRSRNGRESIGARRAVAKTWVDVRGLDDIRAKVARRLQVS